MSNESSEVNRDSLYAEVWTDPVTVVAQRYGLSDVGLAKICRKLAIPLPQRGYWARVKSGQVVKKTPLPKPKSARGVTVSLKRLPSEMVSAKQEAKQRASIARKTLGDIVVPEELTDPHPLVSAASKRLKQRDGWNDPKGLRSAPGEVLNLQVTTDAIARALSMVDTLIKKLELMGVEVSVDTKTKTTWLLIQGTRIAFSVTEQVARSRHIPTQSEIKARDRYWAHSGPGPRLHLAPPGIPDYDYTPTGLLTISAGSWPGRNWRDSNRTSLNTRLDAVIDGLFVFAEGTRAKAEESRRKAEIQRLAEERYQFLMSRRESEQAKFKKLEDDARNYERASRLRIYADVVERRAASDPNGMTPEALEWLAWARAKADWLDPLIEVSDPILDAPEPKRPGYGYW